MSASLKVNIGSINWHLFIDPTVHHFYLNMALQSKDYQLCHFQYSTQCSRTTCNHLPGYSLLENMGEGVPSPAKNLLIPLPSWKNSPHQISIPPTPTPTKAVEKVSCHHCWCTIFVSISYSLDSEIMLILFLIDFQSLKAAFSIEKVGMFKITPPQIPNSW